MAVRQTQKIEKNFTTKISDFYSVPGSVPGLVERIEVHRMEVFNNSTAAARVGWGYRMADSAVKVGDFNAGGGAPRYTDRTTSIAAGTATALGTGGGILIQSPEPFHSVQFNVTIAGGAISALQYWDGTQLKTFNAAGSEHVSYDTLDLTGTGNQFNVFVPPSDMAPVAAGDTLVDDDGVTAGMYVYVITLASVVTVDDFSVVRLLNRLESLADGATLVDTLDGGKKLPGGAKLVAYCSTANKENGFICDYTKVV